MRKAFPGFYKPTNEEFQQLWNTALFVFDTNVLLDLYRYSDDTVENLILTMEKLRERIWIPYRVAFEYHRRLNDIIQRQATAYTDTIKTLNDFDKRFKEKRSHPFLENNLHDEIEAFCKKFDHELSEKQKIIKKLITENPIKERLADIIEDRIGKPFDTEQLEKIYREGNVRYANKVPPGYKDLKEKQGNDIYGDLVIWKEIIEQIKATNSPVIFVTGDVKEDWFQIVMGMTVGPRPELIDELQKEKEVLFYIYPTDSFLKYAQERLQIEVKEQTLAEVREIIEEGQKTIIADSEDSSMDSDVSLESESADDQTIEIDYDSSVGEIDDDSSIN